MQRQFHKGSMTATALLLLTMIGCFTAKQRNTRALVEYVHTHGDDLRWGRYDKAAEAFPLSERNFFLDRVKLIEENLSMGDVEIDSIRFGPKTETAEVTIKVSWYFKDDPTVQNATLLQKWSLKGSSWLIDDQKRARGDRFPLVPEKIKPETPQAPTGTDTKL